MNTGKSGGATRSLVLTMCPLGGCLTRWGRASPLAQPHPVMRAVRARLRPVAVARRGGPAPAPVVNWPIPAAVGHQQVLHRRGDQRRGPSRLGDRAASVQRQQPGWPRRRRVAGWPSAAANTVPPGEGKAGEIADHGAMPGLAHRDVFAGAAAHGDALHAGDEGGGPSGRGVAPVRQHGLGEHVLGVGAGGGEGPGDAAVMADHQERHAGRRRTGQHVPSGVSIRARYQMPGVLNARCGSPASSGAPVAAMRAVHRPLVGGGLGQGERVREVRHTRCGSRRPARRISGCATEALGMPGVVSCGRPQRRRSWPAARWPRATGG